MTEDKKFPVFMDVRIYERPHQRMVFELFYDIAPFTAENFRALCTGEKGVSPKTRKRLRYPNTFFQKVRKGGSYVKGGVFGWETRECVESIYGPHFPVLESNNLKHDKEGLLSMPIGDLEASRSHFLITLKADQSLDSTHVVFGKLVQGLATLRDIGNYCSSMPIEIMNCGMSYKADYVPPGVIVRPCQPRRASKNHAKGMGEERARRDISSKTKRVKISSQN